MPNAVKKLSNKNSLKPQRSQIIRQPYLGNISQDEETMERPTSEYQSYRQNTSYTRELHVHELEPAFLDYSTEDFTETAPNNLVVNLEDLVNEEHYINQISESIHDRKPLSKHCKNWWAATEHSSVKEMQVFFEETTSKKLIKAQQILL